MTLTECQTTLRNLCHLWRSEPDRFDQPPEGLHFSDFKHWLEEEGYGGELNFLIEMGKMDVAKEWFEEELSLHA